MEVQQQRLEGLSSSSSAAATLTRCQFFEVLIVLAIVKYSESECDLSIV